MDYAPSSQIIFYENCHFRMVSDAWIAVDAYSVDVQCIDLFRVPAIPSVSICCLEFSHPS